MNLATRVLGHRKKYLLSFVIYLIFLSRLRNVVCSFRGAFRLSLVAVFQFYLKYILLSFFAYDIGPLVVL